MTYTTLYQIDTNTLIKDMVKSFLTNSYTGATTPLIIPLSEAIMSYINYWVPRYQFSTPLVESDAFYQIFLGHLQGLAPHIFVIQQQYLRYLKNYTQLSISDISKALGESRTKKNSNGSQSYTSYNPNQTSSKTIAEISTGSTLQNIASDLYDYGTFNEDENVIHLADALQKMTVYDFDFKPIIDALRPLFFQSYSTDEISSKKGFPY